jgi:hypothetical protein
VKIEHRPLVSVLRNDSDRSEKHQSRNRDSTRVGFAGLELLDRYKRTQMTSTVFPRLASSARRSALIESSNSTKALMAVG